MRELKAHKCGVTDY